MATPSPLSDAFVVFVLGGPGAGKGTQCAKLVERFGFTHLSAGDLLRKEQESGSANGTMIRQMIKDGQIVPKEVTIGLLRDAMTSAPNSKGYLIDGFPRKLDQAVAFEETVVPCRFVLFFDLPMDVMEGRLLERGKTSGREDDNIESIKKRFTTYIETTMPVIDNYRDQGKLKTINAGRTIEEVFTDVEALFR